MKRIALALVFAMLSAPAWGATLENRAVCSLNEGRTLAELTRYRDDFQAAAAEAGIVDYRIRVLIPRYAGDIVPGRVIWAGTHPASQFDAVGRFYRSHEWASKLRALVTCSDVSMWEIVE